MPSTRSQVRKQFTRMHLMSELRQTCFLIFYWRACTTFKAWFRFSSFGFQAVVHSLSPDYPSDYLLRLSARLSICSFVHSARCKVTVLWLSVSLSNLLLQLVTVRIVPLTISICQSIQPFIEGAALWLSYASFYALYGHSLTTFFQTI